MKKNKILKKFQILLFVFLIPLPCFSSVSQKTKLVDFKTVKANRVDQHPEIKTEINKIIRKGKNQIKQSAESLFKEFPNTKLLPFKFYVREIKLFKHKNPDIISVRLITYSYTGGAHGSKNYYSWNWSKNKKRFLSLDDLINSKNFETIVQKTRAKLFKMQRQNDEYDKHRKISIKNGTSKKADFKIWNLKNSGYVFMFPEYQVASYAAGSFEIYIP